MTEGFTPPSPGRRSAFQQQRVKDTEPEVLLRRALTARGLRYRLQRPLLEDKRRKIDIAFAGSRVAVDVRGCFWHGCPDHCRRGSANAAWWDAKLEANIARDKDTQRRLEEAGWLVMVVWEHDDPDEAADRIKAAVDARRPGSKTVDEETRAELLATWTRLYGD